MTHETKLYRNSRKSLKLLITSGGICIFLLGIFLHSVGLFDGLVRVKSAVFAGAILFIMLFLFFKALVELKDKSARIVLNSVHFVGKTTPLSQKFGVGDWDDVSNIGLHKVGGDTLVVVTINNPSKYADRLPKALWDMAYNEQTNELNVMHSSSEIDVNPDGLFELFTSYWQKSKA